MVSGVGHLSTDEDRHAVVLGSAIGMAGQTVKQLPQYMHFSSFTTTLLFLGSGRIAAVGQAAMMFGTSHVLLSRSWSVLGGVL